MTSNDLPTTEFPRAIGKVAARELALAGYTRFEDLTQVSKKSLLTIHGVGPKSVNILEDELKKRGLAYDAGANADWDSDVRAVEAAYDRAWGEGDIAGVLACLADDVVLVSPRGEVARGVDEARLLLGKFMRGPAAGSVHSSEIVDVALITEDVAVVDGVATVDGVVLDDASVVRHRFTDVLVRRGGRWTIVHVRAYGLVSL